MSDQPEKFDLTSASISDAQQAKLRELFPEVFTEGGKIDFDRLKRTLGETVDAGKERFGLTWPGKADCFKTIQQPSAATLRPARNESVNFDTTGNLIIEGDNLEVLKLLQKSYLGKVKMIYIDPPYNTGNDFIYPDNYTESLDTYLRYTGQVDDEGRKYSTNTDADGRFHSKWLNMMYPRLFLARNLLREDGVIFISIDDREIDNLRLLMQEIFGQENFLGLLIWHSKKGGGGGVKTVIAEHEYIVAYSKANPESAVGKQWVEAQALNLSDKIGPYRKGRELNKWGAGSSRADRPTMYFPIPGPNGEDVYPIRNDGSEGRWRLGKTAMHKIVAAQNALFEKRADGSYIVYEKIRSAEPRAKSFRTILANAGSAAEGTAALKELFDGKAPFDFPKPPILIRKLFDIAGAEDDDVVLDFFCGSGTTAHAVFEHNRDSDCALRFILVQLPESVEGEYPNVAEITKERVRRAVKKLNAEDVGKLALENDTKRDLGFKVFKLHGSNFKAWNADIAKEPVALAKQLEMHVQHIVDGRTQDDLLFEILLKSGFALSTPIETLHLASKTVYSVEQGAMLVCLDSELTPAVIQAMADRQPVRVICLDAGFAGNDQLKTNAVQQMRARGVTKFQPV